MEAIKNIPMEERVYGSDDFNYWHQHRNNGQGRTVSTKGRSWTHPLRDDIVSAKYALGSTPGLEFPYEAKDGSPGVMTTHFGDGSKIEFTDLGTERYERLTQPDKTVIILHHLVRVIADETGYVVAGLIPVAEEQEETSI